MDYENEYPIHRKFEEKEFPIRKKCEEKEHPVRREFEEEEFPVQREFEEREEIIEREKGEERGCMRKRLIEVERVIAIGEAETTLEVCVPLCPPAFEVAENMIGRRVIIDTAIASHGKVFVNGRIVKDIPYKTNCETIHPTLGRVSRLTFGNMKHATFEARFALCINAPGARRGDKVVILEKKVTSVEIPNFVRCRECEPEFLRLDTCMRRLIKSVTEKDCVFVKVKVVKPMMTHFSGKELSEEFLEEY